jgi:AcrR family transcriptional regulator
MRKGLTPERVVAAALDLVAERGADALTLRAVARSLDVDPAAIYRHVADHDTLLRMVADRALAPVLDGVDLSGPWRDVVQVVCTRLRRALLAQPGAARLAADAPTRLPNEQRISAALFDALTRAGLDPDAVAVAYHACIELAVGSAVIDAPIAALDGRTRAATYRRWRAAYGDHPVAPHLYRGTAEERFADAIRLLIDGLRPAVEPTRVAAHSGR